MKGKPIKVTDYCVLWKQVINDNEHGERYAIEKIEVKSTGNEEIRFTYYKKSDDGKFRFVPRPLDLSESALLELFKKEGITEVFSANFLNELRDVLDELCRRK
ncbi:hypothetical protein [Paenibacillus contaminans]|uniref:Uncharacterized protein n=1 Tax=Paenibacillus contaminans TaxID=450362 RepID=A0A329MHN2_9BACL|nr:hypothetical protein [Paenibacillus contaminans]RAV19471.1 hypothetical protein DQG23_21000 [Paenibacillus contaminans]